MDFAVKPISPTHSIPRYRPRKIRDQSEFIEQVARCTQASARISPENSPGCVDVSVDIQEARFSNFG